MMLDHCGSRRNSAPVNGAINGTLASAATGVADLEVGVPTSPIKAKTPCSSIRLRVFFAASSGS